MARIPTHIAAEHPACDLIKRMLMRRGDVEGVAHGRAIALVEALIDTNMLRIDGEFLPYNHDRGIIQMGSGCVPTQDRGQPEYHNTPDNPFTHGQRIGKIQPRC